MSDPLIIYRDDRGANVLKVTLTDERIDLTTTGGGNITQSEYDQITTFIAGRDDAEAFLTRIQGRMDHQAAPEVLVERAGASIIAVQEAAALEAEQLRLAESVGTLNAEPAPAGVVSK